MNIDRELEELALEIQKAGIVISEKQEYDFDADLLVRLRNENDELKRVILLYKRMSKRYRDLYVEYYTNQVETQRAKKIIYKREMERYRRKLTRIYDEFRSQITGEDSVLFEFLKNV